MEILALDLGTQSIRAALVDKDGVIHEIATRTHEVESPHAGWAQQSPSVWWNLMCGAIREVLGKNIGSSREIAAVCACGQMHGPVGIDSLGDITTPQTQLWCDKRCEEQGNSLRERFNEEELSAITANPVTAGWAGLKVLWIKEHEPESYKKTRWYLVPKDFINYRLTGVAATDPSEASGSFLWDAKEDRYSDEMAGRLGIDIQKFPPVVSSHGVVGKVTKDAAAETGLMPGTPVLAGGGDFIVSLLGLGITGNDDAADITGTSTLFAMHRDAPVRHPGIQNLRHVLGGWIPFFMLDCGGLSMKWCRELFGSFARDKLSYEEMIERTELVPPGCDGLLFYPYLMGERRRDNISARGCFSGIGITHGAGHFIRAVMEGVALAIGMNVSILNEHGISFSRVFCAGGGTRNRLLNQIKADVLGITLHITDEPESSLKGAGILGAYGIGMIDRIPLAANKANKHTIINPEPYNSEKYRHLKEEFKRYYDHMLGYWQ